jgi:hypothetical protein
MRRAPSRIATSTRGGPFRTTTFALGFIFVLVVLFQVFSLCYYANHDFDGVLIRSSHGVSQVVTIEALQQQITRLQQKQQQQMTNQTLQQSDVNKLRMELKSGMERVESLERNAGVLPKPPHMAALLERKAAGVPKPHEETLLKGKMAFLHIGKAGGSSFDLIGKKLANQAGYAYIGHKHFDWSYVEKKYGTVGKDVEVVTILRQPVARAISHYYFTKRLKWVESSPYFVKQNLTEFLHDRHALLEFRDIWQDGQAGVSWLTGTHIANWAACPKEEVPAREARASDSVAMMHLAADRLEKCKWFGILEDMDRSMELLQHEFELEERPKLGRSNAAKKKDTKIGDPTEQQLQEIASLMPQDLWLYEFAKRLFEARWSKYKTGGVYTAPERPPLPEMTCISTRFELNCSASGPLGGIMNAINTNTTSVS